MNKFIVIIFCFLVFNAGQAKPLISDEEEFEFDPLAVEIVVPGTEPKKVIQRASGFVPRFDNSEDPKIDYKEMKHQVLSAESFKEC